MQIRKPRRKWCIALVMLILGASSIPLMGMFNRTDARYGVHTIRANEQTLPRAHAAGFDAVVQLFHWWEMEPTRQQFIWQPIDEAVAGAEYYGLDLIARLDQHPEWAQPASLEPGRPPVDLAEYDRWVRTVVERYRGRVPAYIIWNEPNLALEWSGLPPDPAAYVELLRVGYRAVKETDPDAVVVSAGLAPTNTQNDEALDDRLFLEAMYRHGAAEYFDVLGAHPYGFGHPPDDPRGAHDGLNMARLADLREIMVAHGDGDKPVWITEMGWTIRGNAHSAWQEVTPQQQADYLVDALEKIRRDWPWVELVTVWNLEDADHPDWGGYSLLDTAGAPRPAYLALQGSLAEGHPPPVPDPLPDRYRVLAEDAIIHLGDAEMGAPWMPLHRARNPSPEWEGIVYVHEQNLADGASWRLSVRIMQSNFWSNRIWVNGMPLDEPFPLADFSKSWVSHTWTVPAELLRPGPNRIRVTVAHAVPLIQAERFAYDEIQIKDVVLWRASNYSVK